MNPRSSDALVTGVVTTYDRPQLARRAIESAIAQSYRPVEIIVVEDGSSSGIESWLEKLRQRNVRYIQHSENKGLAAARNTGRRAAKGKYVAYLDDDDEWAPSKLAKQVGLAESKSVTCAVIHCGSRTINTAGQVVYENRPLLKGNIREEIARKGLRTAPSSCLFLRAILERVGGYDEELPSHVDHDIWMKLARMNYCSDYVDEFLVLARQHSRARMTTDVDSRIQATDTFVEKWLPEWSEWFGPAQAGRYAAQFNARVLRDLGTACIERGEFGEGMRCFYTIVARNPNRIRFYGDVAASLILALSRQTPFYYPLRDLWRRVV